MWQTWTGGPTAAPIASPGGNGAAGPAAPGQWHPTVIYMLVLVFAEIFLVAWLSRVLLR